MIDQIRPGAPVYCTDDRLGSVKRLEQDGSTNRDVLRVSRGRANPDALVPLDLIRHVRDDGGIELAGSSGEIARLTEGTPAGSQIASAEPAWRQDPAEFGQTVRLKREDHADQAASGEAAIVDSREPERTIELKEERLVPHKELRDVGEVRVRTEVQEVPGRLEVDAYREEVEVEHVPMGQVVTERLSPWEEDGVLVVPVYEEQLVVTKRLLLKEQLRIRRVPTTEKQLFEDTLRRERLVIEDPGNTGLVHERFPTDKTSRERLNRDGESESEETNTGGFLGKVVRKALG